MFFYSKYKLFRAVISTLKIANLPGTPLKIEAFTGLKILKARKSRKIEYLDLSRDLLHWAAKPGYSLKITETSGNKEK